MADDQMITQKIETLERAFADLAIEDICLADDHKAELIQMVRDRVSFEDGERHILESAGLLRAAGRKRKAG